VIPAEEEEMAEKPRISKTQVEEFAKKLEAWSATLSDDERWMLQAMLKGKSEELSDDELDSVAGGGLPTPLPQPLDASYFSTILFDSFQLSQYWTS
jgi:hypothetical protein